jgi:hyperosmotically inducible periplasmic protein
MNGKFASVLHVMAIGGILISFSPLYAFQESQKTAPDNTKVNKRDRSSSERTADQAKETKNDREIMQKIRKAIVADKSLSTYAHNIKVISEHGKVTLKGPVNSAEERKNIEAKAVEVAGSGNVTNQISVKGDKTTTSTR